MKKLINYMNLFKKPGVLLLLLTLFVNASLMGQKTVTGTVLDENGDPLIGANVVIKGTYKGTVTGPNGNFSLEVPQGENILKVSFLGYLTEEVNVSEVSNIEVTLLPDLAKLEEVVVVGYGAQNKIDVSGAVARVDAEDLQDLPIASSGEALRGRVSGVFVQSSTGSPGSEPSILIRGKSSFSTSNDPLIIIDGVESNLNDINFNDIASFNVLKDAASSAIYGTAGANGVILIETKRGQVGKTSFTFDAYTGVEYNPKRLDLLNSEQAFDLVRELNTLTTDNLGTILGDEYISGVSIDTNNLASVNWQDEMYRVAPVSRYHLAASGGNESTKFRVSGSYLTQDGVIRNSYFNRFNIRANFDHELTSKINIAGDIGFSRKFQKGAPTGGTIYSSATLSALSTYPFIPVWDPAYEEEERYFINPFMPEVNVPLANLYSGTSRGNNNSIDSRLSFKYEPVEGLQYSLNLIGTFDFKKAYSYTSKLHTDDGRRSMGNGSSSSSDNTRYDVENIFTYDNSFGKHNLSTLYGYIIQRRRNSSNSANGSHFQIYDSDQYFHLYAATSTGANSGLGFGVNRNSHIARLNYNYNSRYYFKFVFRRDGSSKFGEGNKYGNFPSLTLMWRLSEENFMQNLKPAVSNMKLRVGAGITGNDRIPSYIYSLNYVGGSSYEYPIFGALDINNTPGPDVIAGMQADLDQLPNANIKWEETLEYNLGLDVGFFDNRLSFEGDIYHKSSYDLIAQLALPRTSPAPNGYFNVGEVETRGFEVQLTSYNIDNPDFSWVTNLNISRDQNKVVDLGTFEGLQLQGNLINALIDGQPINVFYGYEANGLFLEQSELDELNTVLPDGTPHYYQTPYTTLGDIKFLDNTGPVTDDDGNILMDQNGEPYYKIDENDKVIIGDPNPDFYFGMNNTFTIKNFDISIFIQGVQGIDIYHQTRVKGTNYDLWTNQLTEVLDRYPYGTEVPRADPLFSNANSRTSDRFVEDGSYVRLKNISFGYDFSAGWLQSLNITKARLYASAENLYTLTNFTGLDPEMVGGNGIENGGYPQYRTFIIGLNLGF